MKVDLNLFKDSPIETHPLYIKGSIRLSDVTDVMKMVYSLGFRDRILSEVDSIDYKRFEKAETINQLIYLAGYFNATVDINLGDFDINKILDPSFVSNCSFGIITNDIHLLKKNVEIKLSI